MVCLLHRAFKHKGVADLQVVIIIIIIKTYLCRMTTSVIKTAINMGPALKKKRKKKKLDLKKAI